MNIWSSLVAAKTSTRFSLRRAVVLLRLMFIVLLCSCGWRNFFKFFIWFIIVFVLVVLY